MTAEILEAACLQQFNAKKCQIYKKHFYVKSSDTVHKNREPQTGPHI